MAAKSRTEHIICPVYYVYLIRNRGTHALYVGYTDDLRHRVKQHRGKNPELVYYEAYKAEADARSRERMLKQRGQAVRRLKERLRHSITA